MWVLFLCFRELKCHVFKMRGLVRVSLSLACLSPSLHSPVLLIRLSARPRVTQVTGFLLLLWAPWFLCSALRALPRSPKEKERKENSDNHFRATKEVGEACLVLPHISPLSIYMHAFVPLTLSILEKCVSLLHVWLATFCFLDKGFVFFFPLFFQGGGVAELVRKLETEPPTVEVSQPSI